MDNGKRRPILRYTLDAVPQVRRETTGGQSTRNLYGLDLFAQQQGEATTYLGYDALSVRLHLVGGAIAATYRYGPFGEMRGDDPEGYGYTGEQWDDYIKMTFLRARYYQPEIGRFVRRDSWAGNLRQPGTLRRYVYVLNNPVNLVDPSGLQGGPPEWHAVTDTGIELDLIAGGRYGKGLLRYHNVWWDVYVPLLGLSMQPKNPNNPQQKWCWWSNSDTGSEWWTFETIEIDTELPWRSRLDAGIAPWGNWSMRHNEPFSNYLGPATPDSAYENIVVDLRGVASLPRVQSVSLLDANAPAYLGDYRNVVQFFPYNNGRNVNIEATDLYQTEGSVTGQTAMLAAGLTGMMALAAGPGEKASPNMRRLHISLQVQSGVNWSILHAYGFPAERRAIIRSFRLFEGKWGTNISPAYLYWDEKKAWAEESIIYSPEDPSIPFTERPWVVSSRSKCTTAASHTCPSFDWLILP